MNEIEQCRQQCLSPHSPHQQFFSKLGVYNNNILAHEGEETLADLIFFTAAITTLGAGHRCWTNWQRTRRAVDAS